MIDAIHYINNEKAGNERRRKETSKRRRHSLDFSMASEKSTRELW